MNYFIDTEFSSMRNGDGESRIELISVGLVDERGRTFYAENSSCDRTKFSEWIWQNVVPHLEFEEGSVDEIGTDFPYPGDMRVVGGPDVIAEALMEFIEEDCDPEEPTFWGWYCQHDWVLFCSLFGDDISELPDGWPRTCRELSQFSSHIKTPEKTGRNHHALDDAIWHKKIYDIKAA